MSDNYEDMTVAELKVMLKERGLPVSGKKSDLIERLSQSPEEDLNPVEEATGYKRLMDEFGYDQEKVGKPIFGIITRTCT